MKSFKGIEEQEAMRWMEEAANVAQKALCLRAKCGTVIVKDGEIIGEGYNAPPLDDFKNSLCLENRAEKGKHDRTCCMHAEWRAILDGTKRNPEKMKGSKLFFTRVNEEGKILKSGQPYCSVCSRLALDAGVAEFILGHEAGICSYNTREYNCLSFQ